jgi:hypothetical protein
LVDLQHARRRVGPAKLSRPWWGRPIRGAGDRSSLPTAFGRLARLGPVRVMGPRTSALVPSCVGPGRPRRFVPERDGADLCLNTLSGGRCGNISAPRLVNVDAWLLLSNQAAHIAVGPVATTPGGADFLLAALVELARRSEGPSAMAALQAAVNASVASVVGGARSPSGPKSDPLLWAEVGSPEHELCRDESQRNAKAPSPLNHHLAWETQDWGRSTMKGCSTNPGQLC